MTTNNSVVSLENIISGDESSSSSRIVDVFGVIEDIAERKAANQKSYIVFKLRDSKHSVSCKVWEKTLADIKNVKNGDIVKLRGEINHYKGEVSLVVHDYKGTPMVRPVDDKDGVNVDDFYKIAPVSFEIMYEYLLTTVNSFKNDELKNICNLFLTRYEEELKYFPGAKVIHHAYKAGLIYHLYNMTKQAVSLSSIYSNLNMELLISGVLLHDVGKLKTMNSNEYGVVSEFTLEGILLEHLACGIAMVENMCNEINISHQTKLLLLHMVSSHHGRLEWGSIKPPAFLEAEVLHHIDCMDSNIASISESIEKVTEETGISELTRGRYFYKHNL